MVTQLVTPAADRPFPQARGLGHRLQPAVPQFEGFAGRPAAPSSLIEIRLKAGELSSEDFDNASVYHVINVVQIDEIGQLFIYDDYVEAIAHLRQGLALLETLPETPECTQHKVEMHIVLGAS